MIKIERSGIVAEFSEPKLSKYNKLVFKCKLSSASSAEESVFYASEFCKNKSAIVFIIPEVISGKKINGVKLEKEDFEKLSKLEADLIAERESEIENIVNRVVSGDIKIEFGIVGCDYRHYQSWLHNLPDHIDVQGIMEMAIKRITGEKYLECSTACEYLERCAKKIYGSDFNMLNLGEMFEIDMISLITPHLTEKRTNAEIKQKKIDAIFAKAKETGEKQELYRYSDDCDDEDESCDIDIVTEYAMPDGTVEIIRTHTW